MLRLVSACEDLQPTPEDQPNYEDGSGSSGSSFGDGVRGGQRSNSTSPDLSFFALIRGILPGWSNFLTSFFKVYFFNLSTRKQGQWNLHRKNHRKKK